jgi:DNA-directed RNA polymerase subunit L
MEFKVLEESKTKLVFQLPGETHTFCNLLKKVLQDTKGVLTATYRIDHPLTGVPQFLIETKGIEPRKALQDALKSVKKLADEFKKEVSKL